MSALRAKAREVAEALLTGSRLPVLARALSAHRPLIIAYHNIVSDASNGHGDTTLHLPSARFAEQVEILVEYFDVIALHELRSAGRGSGKPRIVITFDDAYAGAVRNALPLLARAGLPATMFVAPRRLGGHAFWWDAVEGPHGPGPTGPFRSHVLHRLGGSDEDAVASASAFGLRQKEWVPPESRTASEGELMEALRSAPFLTLGSHSWSHACLSSIPGIDLREELARSLEWIKRLGNRGVPWIAYPYGCVTDEVEMVARETGYVGGLRIEGGAITRRELRQFSLPRTDIPARLSRHGFMLRASGIVR